MARRIVTLLCLLAAAGFAGEIAVPAAGCTAGPGGTLYAIGGFPGNFLTGRAIAAGAVSWACSGTAVLVKTAAAVEWLGPDGELVRRWGAPAASAAFGFRADGLPGAACFSGGLCFTLSGETEWFRLPADEVLAVAADGPAGIVSIVERAGALLWLERGHGHFSEQPLTDAVPPLALLDRGTVVFARGAAAVIGTRDGGRRLVPLPSLPARLDPAGSGRVRITLDEGHGCFLLQVFEDRHELYRLPEVLP
jgi:hypothetical protein